MRYELKATMADGTVHKINKLLTRNNVKLDKSNAKSNKYLTFGLSLAPHIMSGYNTCASSTAGCRAACIVSSGYGGIFPKVNQGRIARTRLFFQNRPLFKAQLFKEIGLLNKRAKKIGKKLAIRLNVFSDLKWEVIFPDLFVVFKDVQFYDYTRHSLRMYDYLDGKLPKNYNLTFSKSELNEKECKKVLEKGGNISAVFAVTRQQWQKGNIPKKWDKYKVFDGDKTDLRFIDPKNRVIGLFAKGDGRNDKSGFVINIEKDKNRFSVSLPIVK